MFTERCVETELKLTLLLGSGVSLEMLAHDAESLCQVFWKSSCNGLFRDKKIALWRDTTHTAIAPELDVRIGLSCGTNE
ncbi:Hypothetical Protein FCC1311_084842 [Hondaea fermentalgiana]|uniref:Uncharacterized protein n=1 Tax=Hondaea fermentalgiana TaxID=2315210 RepID=A0A2R5GPM7_9STRA|nr:Hypothetical Protein FCC1311_084842 [Hondaea fermentalgiana]|eukprot:GBG32259.1 Hypothetical Protein FCC1311_084842 [Hondaea fermentalgiana]